jgi:hypothetical protein
MYYDLTDLTWSKLIKANLFQFNPNPINLTQFDPIIADKTPSDLTLSNPTPSEPTQYNPNLLETNLILTKPIRPHTKTLL